jgi:DGQHR domain-containing protein
MAVTYPATRGYQSGREVYSLQMSFYDFKLLTSFAKFELPSDDPATKAALIDKNCQRPLNEDAVKKLANYIKTTESYTLPPIILIIKKKGSEAKDPKKLGYTFTPNEGCEDYVIAGGELKIDGNVAELIPQDGNHRAHAIKLLLENTDEFNNESIGIQISPYEGRDLRQAHFSALNKTIPVQKNLQTYYADSGNDLGIVTKHILSNTGFNTLVKREGSIRPGNPELFQYLHFKDAIKESLKPVKFILDIEAQQPKFKIEQSQTIKFLTEVWDLFTQKLADFKGIIDGEFDPTECRENCIYNQSFVKALGISFAELIDELMAQTAPEPGTIPNLDLWVKILTDALNVFDEIDFERDNHDWQEIGYVVVKPADGTLGFGRDKVKKALSEYLTGVICPEVANVIATLDDVNPEYVQSELDPEVECAEVESVEINPEEISETQESTQEIQPEAIPF